MATKFRKLNEAGIALFAEYIRNGAEGEAPSSILENPDTTDPIQFAIQPGTGLFQDRYVFGAYLNTLLRDFDPATISGDVGLWSALALFWFDRLCPLQSNGSRTLKRDYSYILSPDYRHYYRHLVRSPWQLVRDHGEASRFLLIRPGNSDHPLSVHGEILEQIGGRQQVLRSRPIIKAANKLYFDESKCRPKKGVAGNIGGTARRFGIVLRQFELTFDPEAMSDDALIGILPKEFDRWQKTS